jgi:hypothetical protein
MKNRSNRYPTAELNALELAAHRARSRVIARLILAGSAGVIGLIDRLTHGSHAGGKAGHA